MTKKMVLGLVFGAVLAAATSWAAASKCDAGISKAVGKKVACQCSVYSKAQKKGLPVDLAKLAKCGTKFISSCGKAQANADCAVQTGTCANKELQADSASGALCLASPSGAFID